MRGVAHHRAAKFGKGIDVVIFVSSRSATASTLVSDFVKNIKNTAINEPERITLHLSCHVT